MLIGENITNNCSSQALASILNILKNILTVIQIIGPILLIISLTVTIVKLMNNPDEKKLKGKIRNEIIAIILLFSVPFIINATMSLLGDNFSVAECWNGVGNFSSKSSYINSNKNKKNSINSNRGDFEKGDERKNNNNNSSSSSSNGTSSVSATGSGNFVKYNLSDSQLRALTALALHEQGTAKGAAAEASLMANRFELHGSKYGSGADGLVNYVRSSGWFAHASSHMADTGIVTSSALAAVKSVLVDGKRTLPGYVDEHDCFSDISSISTGSVRDRSAYKPFVTIIKNRYTSTYTFYSFPDSNSDPFGYTSEENRKRIGDDCYSFGS